MNKKEKILICIIAVLGLLVVVMGSYIVYDKVIGNDINENNNISADNDDMNNDVDNVGDKENLLSEEDAKLILKELDEKYFACDNDLGPCCDGYDRDDYISFGSYETNDFRDYWASTKFKSISDLKEYFESIMVEDLIPKYIDNGVTYIERDGKLYCQLPHKGGGFTRNYDINSIYDIISIKENIIVSDVFFFGYDMSDELSSLRATITIVKNDDGKWLVSVYEIKR